MCAEILMCAEENFGGSEDLRNYKAKLVKTPHSYIYTDMLQNFVFKKNKKCLMRNFWIHFYQFLINCSASSFELLKCSNF